MLIFVVAYSFSMNLGMFVFIIVNICVLFIKQSFIEDLWCAEDKVVNKIGVVIMY